MDLVIMLLGLVAHITCKRYTDSAVKVYDTDRQWFNDNIVLTRMVMVGELFSFFCIWYGGLGLLFSLLFKR